MNHTTYKTFATFLAAGVLMTAAQTSTAGQPRLIQGADLNSAKNPVVQPQDPALSGGGRDQSLQFGDTLFGSHRSDVINGRLGADVMFGGPGHDVFLGGLEHFNPLSRIDRAFGSHGNDIFLWKPGDGSDAFIGGRGHDALVFGLVGEVVNGEAEFRVVNDQKAGPLWINPFTGLPEVDVSNSPGFCEVVAKSDSKETRVALDTLGVDHLVRFVLRGVRDAFEAGDQTEDNGVRVTIHTDSVEYVVCTSREGGQIEVIDLTGDVPHFMNLQDIHSHHLRKRLDHMVF